MAKGSRSGVKAYKNQKFLNSPDARIIRMMAEYLEPLSRFRNHGIYDTIVFFGSSRVRSSDEVRRDMEQLQQTSSPAGDESGRALAKLAAEGCGAFRVEVGYPGHPRLGPAAGLRAVDVPPEVLRSLRACLRELPGAECRGLCRGDLS